MKKFAIIEIGSTNTKGYLYADGKVHDCGFCTIEFKNNYQKTGLIINEDKEKLYSFIEQIREIEKQYMFLEPVSFVI